MYSSIKLAAATLAAGIMAGTSADAAIMVEVDYAGAGFTSWTFSGSATATGRWWVDDDDGNVHGAWDIGSEFYSGVNENIDFISTDASFVHVGGATYDILGVGAHYARSNTHFGIAIDRQGSLSANYLFPADATFESFTGTGIAPVDISEFKQGVYNVSAWRFNNPTNPDSFIDAQFNVIPSPTAALAGLIGIGGLAARRRRK